MPKKAPLYEVEQIREIFNGKDGWRKQSHCADTLETTRYWFNIIIQGERTTDGVTRKIPMSKDMQRRISDYLAVYK